MRRVRETLNVIVKDLIVVVLITVISMATPRSMIIFNSQSEFDFYRESEKLTRACISLRTQAYSGAKVNITVAT